MQLNLSTAVSISNSCLFSKNLFVCVHFSLKIWFCGNVNFAFYIFPLTFFLPFKGRIHPHLSDKMQ